MSKEILLVAEAVSNEKGVDKDIIFEAIEAALASAAKKRYESKKHYEEDVDVLVEIDRRSGDYATFRRWQVVAEDAELEIPAQQMPLPQALETHPDVHIGDWIQMPIENADFGRIAGVSSHSPGITGIQRFHGVDQSHQALHANAIVAGPISESRDVRTFGRDSR